MCPARDGKTHIHFCVFKGARPTKPLVSMMVHCNMCGQLKVRTKKLLVHPVYRSNLFKLNALICQKPDHHLCMSMLDIPNTWVLLWSFTLITASTPLGRLSTRFWNVSVGIFSHLEQLLFFDEKIWFTIGVPILPKGNQWVWGQGAIHSSWLPPHRLVTPCLYGEGFVHRSIVTLEENRAFPKTVTPSLEGQNCLKSPCILWQ